MTLLVKVGGIGGNQGKSNNKSCEIHILRPMWIFIISEGYIKEKMYNCLPLIKKIFYKLMYTKIKIKYPQHNFDTGNSNN